ncbi:MAG TPA: 2Fe-2S iron-sulfur cluster-binding protein [Pseudobdellovibrionaceae bacterium]|jgi:2Fe-2S ferredoxin
MKVKFIPQNIELEGTPEKSLLQIATENHIEIKSICKGVPSCAECRVRVVEGENNILPPNKAELSLIGTNWRIDSRRLACQMRCFGDVTVDLTEQLERQENQNKKVRGFRSQKQKESHAVQDTMLLTEKPEEGTMEQEPQRPPQQQKQQQQRQQQGRQQGKQQNQGQRQNQNQNQKQGQKQNPRQNPKQPQKSGSPNNPQTKQSEKAQDRNQKPNPRE